MRRLGRYPLAVMAWIAVYAGWSSVLGLVVAAVTGETLDDGEQVGATVSLGVSTLFTILLPLVPTLVTLWFNDWLRDGAPSRADRERAQRAARAAAAIEVPPERPAPDAVTGVAPGAPIATGIPQTPAPVVAAIPLGVPELGRESAAHGAFPVARLLRGQETAPQQALSEPTVESAAPLIDPVDPLGVGDLGLPRSERG